MAWTSDDINELHNLLQNRYPIADIARIMQRSKKSVAKAAKNMLIQQLLHHTPNEVAENYNMSIDELRKTIVSEAFYMPVKERDLPASVYMFLIVLLTAGISRFGMVLSHNWYN